MNTYQIAGRVSLGACLIGLGIIHLIYPGIRPIIIPDATHLSAQLYWLVYVTAALLIAAGVFVVADKYIAAVSLSAAIVFFLLFAFFHLPAFLSVQGMDKLKYWTNLNKVLALSGGFLVLAAIDLKRKNGNKANRLLRILSITGRCFFGVMLFVFGLGHITSTTAMSGMVPKYIPFAVFWTFLGGLILMGSAISFFSGFQLRRMAILLAGTLAVWLLTLHLYYAFQFPNWQEGEHFIGSLTCLAFMGIALLLYQRKDANLSSINTAIQLPS